MRRTKIICTLGPASNTEDSLVKMIKAGMDVARLNFSHSDYEHHTETIKALKSARKKTKKLVPLMIDTSGPEIRTGEVDGEIKLKKGSNIDIVYEENGKCTPEKLCMSYENLSQDVEEGTRILVDDGRIALKVTSTSRGKIKAKVMAGGLVTSRRGVNVPNAKINLPTITEEDKEDILFGIEQDFDFVAVSFVRSQGNVKEARGFLDDNGAEDMKIISKIESREGVDNIDEILEASDGVMIARGDLGVEIPYAEVPSVQKMITRKCLESGKIVITATEMLDSMQDSPVPTRAEVSDVYNAVVESSTCLMLSGETAAGKHPVKSVKAMDRIIRKAEKGQVVKVDGAVGDTATSVCYAVVAGAKQLNAGCIVAYSESGSTAMKVSSFRPNTPIVVISPNEKTLRQSHMLWGVTPHYERGRSSIKELFTGAPRVAKEMEFAGEGDYVIAVAGTPVGVPGSTNTMRICRIGHEHNN